MLQVVNILSSLIKSTRRRIKVLGLGKSDTRELYECAPFGVDATPPKGYKAIYAETGVKGKGVIIGYINTNQVAAIGEHRVYSTDADGKVKTYIHLKNDGTCELAGSVDNAVRYSELNKELQQFIQKVNTELAEISLGIGGAGGSYTPTVFTLDISKAKITEIKTP